MSYDFCLKEGDLYPPLQAYLKQADNTTLVLSEEDTVKFIMTPLNDRSTVIIDVDANINSYAEGLVTYTWQEGDTDNPGLYQGEFVVMLDGTTRMTVPNNDYFIIKIDHKLG
jgi:hypothetical protein